MSEAQEGVGDEKKVYLRSQNQWKQGEKFPISYAPTVEGMVVSTRWIEHVLMVVFLSPPFAKPEGTWAEASLMYKSAVSLVRKTLPSYEFPFPSDPRIVDEVKKANGNVDMLQELVKYLNKLHPPPASIDRQVQKISLRNETAADQIELENSDRLSLHLLLSQQDPADQVEQSFLSDKIIDKLADAVTKRLSIKSPDLRQHQPLAQKGTKKKRQHKTNSSSSSTSQDSDSGTSSSSSDDEKVGLSDSEDGKGWFICPFSENDSRITAEPRKKMQGKIEERRYVRKALHDIYSEYNSLKAFVDTIRAESISSSSKPYNSDLIWLSCHATYLDLLLLHASTGSWSTWNELVVDSLMRAFLELLVRSSTNRAYPEILDEKVRKWMKRKRVGLSGQFGAIPTYLAGAKITDSGIHPKGGWETKSFNKNFSSSSAQNLGKKQSQNAASDKKA